MIIADTSGLISLTIKTDRNYKNAIKLIHLYSKVTGTILVPEDVFSEMINILGKKFNHSAAYKAAQYILHTNIFIIENSTEKIRVLALNKFREQPESVSFTDCLVMATADNFETKEIFGFDEAFYKSGYTRLGIDDRE